MSRTATAVSAVTVPTRPRRRTRVRLPRLQGSLSGARNAAVAAARGEVVAFLDDDAAAEPDWTERLLAAYRDPRVLGVGGAVHPRWDDGRPDWFPPEFDRVVGCSYRGLPERPGPVRNFIGANMSFRRSALVEAGGFRTDLGRIGSRPLRCEETELCLRITARHPEAVLHYEPSAAVSRHSGSRRGLSSERRYLTSTLPRAAAGARPPVLRALCAGLGATVLGYAAGRIRQRATGPDTSAADGPAARASLLLSRIALPIALSAWLLTLPQVDLNAMGGLGLVQVLPIAFWAALALLTLGFCATLRRRRPSKPLLTGYLLALIAQLHATPALAHTGSLPAVGGSLGVYHSWPGFFSLNAGIMQLFGLNSPLSYAAWMPLLTNALLLAPLLVLFRGLGRSRRLAWAGVWTFYCCSWVGQDYYAPQAFAYVLSVVVLACVVRRLTRGAPTRPGWRWIALVSVPILAIAVSHPLTPLVLTGTLAALALRRRYRPVVLPVLPVLLVSAVVMAGRDLSGGWSYVGPTVPSLLHDLTQPLSNVGAGLVRQTNPSAAQTAIDWTDRTLSAVVVLAAVAALLRFRSLRRTPLPLLIAAPLPWLALNSYGNEMSFRVFFALPGLAFAAASLLFRPLLAPGRGWSPTGRASERRPSVPWVALRLAVRVSPFFPVETWPGRYHSSSWLPLLVQPPSFQS